MTIQYNGRTRTIDHVNGIKQKKRYHTVRTVPKSNRETRNLICIPGPCIYMFDTLNTADKNKVVCGLMEPL